MTASWIVLCKVAKALANVADTKDKHQSGMKSIRQKKKKNNKDKNVLTSDRLNDASSGHGFLHLFIARVGTC